VTPKAANVYLNVNIEWWGQGSMSWTQF